MVTELLSKVLSKSMTTDSGVDPSASESYFLLSAVNLLNKKVEPLSSCLLQREIF